MFHQPCAQVARALGVDQNKVVVRVKRIGGGFGGKETAASLVAVPVAVAARKHGLPVRCMLDRDEDMVVVGGRHPFIAKYKVGATFVPSLLCRVRFAGEMRR